MVGLGALAVGAAPLAGGFLLGGMTGRFQPNAPDLRGVIKSELELLALIPEDQVDRRAALTGMIRQHIDDLLLAQEKRREFQNKTRYFTDRDNWRDIVLFVTTVLFAVIIWYANHHRPIWLPLFIATVLMSMATAAYVVRGVVRSVRTTPHGDHEQRDRDP